MRDRHRSKPSIDITGRGLTIDEQGRFITESAIQMAKRKEPCVLCGRRTGQVGIFQPYNPQEFGAKDSKNRICVYAICTVHNLKDPKVTKRIEDKLLESLT